MFSSLWLQCYNLCATQGELVLMSRSIESRLPGAAQKGLEKGPRCCTRPANGALITSQPSPASRSCSCLSASREQVQPPPARAPPCAPSGDSHRNTAAAARTPEGPSGERRIINKRAAPHSPGGQGPALSQRVQPSSSTGGCGGFADGVARGTALATSGGRPARGACF